MAEKSNWYSRILKEIDPREFCKSIQCFFSHVFREFEFCNIEQLKDEHKQILIKLRLDYSELIDDILVYCDNTLPSTEYILEQLRKSSSLDLNELRRMSEQLNRNQLIDHCITLRKAIIELNDQIKNDNYYKTTGLKHYLRTMIDGALCVGFVVLVCVMPWALPFEIAIVASAALIFAGTIPSTIQFFKDLTAVPLEKDIAHLSEKLTEAKTHVGNITNKLSDIRLNHNNTCIRLEKDDVENLTQFYESMTQSIKKLRNLRHNALKRF